MKYIYNLKINSVIFIESLNIPDTTIELFESVKADFNKKNIQTHYVKVNNKIELIDRLNGIAKNNPQLFPLIHIATHGDESGLILREGKVFWHELIQPITNINISSENHLFLMMASCFGSHAIELLQSTKRAPFYVMVGPAKKINENFLDNTVLKPFYTEFSKNFNFYQAMQVVKDTVGIGKLPFHIIPSLRFFRTSISNRKKRLNSGKIRHELLDHLKEKFNNNIPYELKSMIQHPDQILELEKSVFKDTKEEYFMIDLYPENKSRFAQVKHNTFEEE